MIHDIPDHPVVRNMEQTGHPDGKEPEYPRCPLCGGECEKIYKHRESREVMGCDLCIEEIDPWEI